MVLLCCESSLFHFFSNSRIVLEFLTYLFQQFLLRVFFSLSINFFTFKQMKIYKELRLHFSEKKAMALLYKLEQHTVELVKLSRRIVELSREMEAKWSQKSV